MIWIGNFIADSYLSELTRLAAVEGVDFEPKIGISDAEIVDSLNRAAIMLYAPRLEPFGFAPLEGNACGLPVIAVAEGGVRESVIDSVNGLLVEHDERAMASAVEHLLDRPAYARQLGENGCKMVAERWTVEHAVDRLERLLLGTEGGPTRQRQTAESR